MPTLIKNFWVAICNYENSLFNFYIFFTRLKVFFLAVFIKKMETLMKPFRVSVYN